MQSNNNKNTKDISTGEEQAANVFTRRRVQASGDPFRDRQMSEILEKDTVFRGNSRRLRTIAATPKTLIREFTDEADEKDDQNVAASSAAAHAAHVAGDCATAVADAALGTMNPFDAEDGVAEAGAALEGGDNDPEAARETPPDPQKPPYRFIEAIAEAVEFMSLESFRENSPVGSAKWSPYFDDENDQRFPVEWLVDTAAPSAAGATPARDNQDIATPSAAGATPAQAIFGSS